MMLQCFFPKFVVPNNTQSHKSPFSFIFFHCWTHHLYLSMVDHRFSPGNRDSLKASIKLKNPKLADHFIIRRWSRKVFVIPWGHILLTESLAVLADEHLAPQPGAGTFIQAALPHWSVTHRLSPAAFLPYEYIVLPAHFPLQKHLPIFTFHRIDPPRLHHLAPGIKDVSVPK